MKITFVLGAALMLAAGAADARIMIGGWSCGVATACAGGVCSTTYYDCFEVVPGGGGDPGGGGNTGGGGSPGGGNPGSGNPGGGTSGGPYFPIPFLANGSCGDAVPEASAGAAFRLYWLSMPPLNRPYAPTFETYTIAHADGSFADYVWELPAQSSVPVVIVAGSCVQ